MNYPAGKWLPSMAYHGGKSGGNPAGKWIASMLPWDYQTTYVEPFAGMLGVLLQRKPVINEIVNDLNGDIYNWWIQVRDNYDELSRLLAMTPRARQAFDDARALLDSGGGSPVRRAHATQVVIMQSLMHAVDSPGWVPMYILRDIGSCRVRWVGKEVANLAARLSGVQIENKDAVELLERTAICPHAVVYCDPPYRTAETSCYGKDSNSTDWGRMADALQAQQGKCAVSGYGDEWDALGWQRFEFTKTYRVSAGVGKRTSKPRTEVLWCNYQPETAQTRLEL